MILPLEIIEPYWQAMRSISIPFVWLSCGAWLVTSVFLSMWESFSSRKGARFRFYLSLSASVLVLFFTAWQWLRGGSSVWGIFSIDRFSLFFSLIVIVMLLLVLCQTHGRDRSQANEIFSLPLLSALGAVAVIHSHDLLGIYIGYELTILPLVVWLGNGVFARHRHEVMTKYYLTTGLGSLCLFVGLVFIYGALGKTELAEVFAVGRTQSLDDIQELGRLLFLGGVAIKMGWVPFYFSEPDVYEGGDTVSVGFMAVISKLVGVTVLSRLVIAGWSPTILGWTHLLGIAGSAAVIIGPLQALQQSHFKRRMAYAAIGHVGFLLLALAVAGRSGRLQEEAFVAFSYYVLVYMILIMGLVAVIMAAARRGDEPLELTEFSGLARIHPWLACSMALFVLGLAGVPMTAGFIGVFSILRVVFDGGLIIYGSLALIGWALSLFGALSIIQILFFKPASEKRMLQSGYSLLTGIFVCLLLTAYWGLFPSKILLLIRDSVRSFLY